MHVFINLPDTFHLGHEKGPHFFGKLWPSACPHKSKLLGWNSVEPDSSGLPAGLLDQRF